MSGVSVKVIGAEKIAKLSKKIASLNKQAVHTIAVQIGEEARDLVLEGFSAGHAPDGTAWAPLKVRSGMPLRNDGGLAGSITFHVSGLNVSVGTNVWYGAVHQKGMVIKPKKKKALYSAKLKIMFGKKVTIPARPFLPVGTIPAAWGAKFKEVAGETIEAVLL